MWNLKKGHNELLCRTDTDSQTLKNLWSPKETVWCLGGCAVVVDFTDHCTSPNVINSLINKKTEKKPALDNKKVIKGNQSSISNLL